MAQCFVLGPTDLAVQMGGWPLTSWSVLCSHFFSVFFVCLTWKGDREDLTILVVLGSAPLEDHSTGES